MSKKKAYFIGLLSCLSLATITTPIHADNHSDNNNNFATVAVRHTGKSFKPYKTTIRKNSQTAYKIYKSGGYNTTAENITAIKTSPQYRGETVTITGTETSHTPDAHHVRYWSRIKQNNHTIGWINTNALDKKNHQIVGVPLISQRPELPTGCEMTALTMMFNYGGSKISKLTVAKKIPRSKNPDKGFVGNPYSNHGWCVYPKALMPLIKQQLGSAKNLTNTSTVAIKRSLRINHPVVVWLAPMDGFRSHTLTMTGYNHKTFYINDPWTVKHIKISEQKFNRLWKNNAKRAISY